jgi:deoxyribonuclease IV
VGADRGARVSGRRLHDVAVVPAVTDAIVPTPDGVTIAISGSPETTVGGGTHRGIARCRALGIDGLEIAWVHSVAITEAGAARVREASVAHGVRLSVHGPYYVNLNSADPSKVDASVGRIVAAGRAAAWCGARDVVFHLAFNHDDHPAVVLRRVADGLLRAAAGLDAAGVAMGRDVVIRAETMGRASQFGDLDETLRLCQLVPGVAPCIDIAHLHARTGGVNTPGEFDGLWDACVDALGPSALATAHVHISGIAYGDKGEREHLALDASDLDYRAFLGVMRDRGVRGTVVVESPERERDVAVIQAAWRGRADPRGASTPGAEGPGCAWEVH